MKKKSLEVKDGEAQMRLVYDSYQDYAGFNHVDFYVETLTGPFRQDMPLREAFFRSVTGRQQKAAMCGDPV